jgi:transcription termination factor Rho
MTRKTLSLNAKKSKTADTLIKDLYPGEPRKRFLNGVAIHPA